MDNVSVAWAKYWEYLEQQPQQLRDGFMNGSLDSPTLCRITQEIVEAELVLKETHDKRL